jgi:hypothetical protein
VDPITAAILIVMLLPIAFGRTRASSWMVRKVESGSMARRTAIWLVAMLTIGPYVLLYLWILASDPGYWWLALILFCVSWPLIALPMIVVIHQTTESKPNK